MPFAYNPSYASRATSDAHAHEPTEAEIAAACERIRETWSPAELRRRALGLPDRRQRPPWEVPVIHMTPEIAAALEAA